MLKDIPGYDGYKVDDCGQIWSCRAGGGHKSEKWHKLKPNTKKHGYLGITLFLNGKRKYHTVHYIVLITFVGPKPTGLEARHLDGNPSNNNINNLKWGTKQENWLDKIRHGKYAGEERHYNAKLTKEIVIKLRNEYADGGITMRELAEKYGLHKHSVSHIIRKKSWKYV